MGYAIGLLAVCITTGLAHWIGSVLTPPDLVMLYLLPIMAVAYRFERQAALVTAAMSVAAYDYFFVYPYFTFSVADPRQILTCTILFLVGMVTSDLMTRIRHQQQEARERQSDTEALYNLSREVLTSLDDEEVAQIITRHAATLFKGEAGIWLEDGHGGLHRLAVTPDYFQLSEQAMGMVRWCCDHGQSAGRGTDTFPDESFTVLPLVTGRIHGALAIRIGNRTLMKHERSSLLSAFARQATLAMDRTRLGEEVRSATIRVQSEEMRATLLSMASHDLRTPLAAITGASTALRDEETHLDASQHKELLETICTEADRMERLITNLLDMARLDSGLCHLNLEWIPFEELIGSTLVRLEKRLLGRKVIIHVDETVAMIHVDPVLFQQVLVNLLDNALKHAPDNPEITWNVHGSNERVIIRIGDRGPGILPGMEEKIFEKFVRGAGSGVPGSGLGLAICRGVIQAHQGTIHAINRARGGVEFRIELPQPPLPMDCFSFDLEAVMPEESNL
ncbi:MAG: DUF4118 domain-containing protein [Magnetococcales bacterium]|nr:DUF4118 domain-containing protein [Magnetococcales bacterium]NGZ05328.1 DUF4118 domain-containing protein [Magnetococcales bacterium]